MFLTVHNDTEVVDAALAAGGSGYVIKSRLASDLLLAVREARARRTFVSLLQLSSSGHYDRLGTWHADNPPNPFSSLQLLELIILCLLR